MKVSRMFISAITGIVLAVTPSINFGANIITAKIITSTNTHPDKNFEYTTIPELIDIFTKRKTHWDDRTEIVVVTHKLTSPEHTLFLSDSLGITPYQYRSRLQRNIYQGRAKPPIEVRSEEELVDRVTTIDGAIGYIFNYIIYMENDKLVIINVEDF